MTRSECYQICLDDLNRRISEKKARRESALFELEQNNPRYAEVKRLISMLGAKVAITALSGKTDELGRLQETIMCLSDEQKEIIEKSGIGEIEYDCEVCHDTGYVNGKICDCINRKARELILKGLSEKVLVNDCRFENFDLNYYKDADTENGNPKKRMTEVLKLCRDYVMNFSPLSSKSLLFMGNTGLGKTHLSLAIASELISAGYDVMYGSAYNLFAKMETEHFGEHSDTSYTEATNCDLLIIDDLGGEFVSPYIQSLVYNIINTRLLSRRPTIINTNLSMAEINRIYTPRVASRLLGDYTAKKFIGNDIRQIRSIEN